jgi:hypothetical protein
MLASPKIFELRRLLAERFPHARRSAVPARPPPPHPTGVATLDELLGGGLARGELCELVGAGPGSGSAQVIHQLLRQTARDGRFMALIDGSDSFEVDTVEPEVLCRLLWARCSSADEALKAADFLLRDRNFPVIALDLKLNSPAELRKISSAVWFRFARLLEQNPASVLVVTPQPLVSGAPWRARVESGLALDALSRPPGEIAGALRFALLRSPAEAERESAQAG